VKQLYHIDADSTRWKCDTKLPGIVPDMEE